MIFAPTNPEKIASQQLYEAKRLLLDHRAAAEHHDALARMYEARIARLTPNPAAPSASQQPARVASKE